MKKKIVLLVIFTLIATFIVGHSTPKLALRSHLLAMLNGSSVVLVLSNIEEIDYKDKGEYPESRFFLVKDSKSRSSFANDYVWGVKKKGFLYFAYIIGKG